MRTRERLFELVTAGRVFAGLGRALEWVRYGVGTPPTRQRFWIVSCARNAGEAAIRCLESVYAQRYDRSKIVHLFIDDASDDGTELRVEEWLRARPDHSVRYRRNPRRVGGTPNTVTGFREAPPGSIVIELNGDDWLPDPGVLAFFDRVYADGEVWMTYNSVRSADPALRVQSRPVPPWIVRDNRFREYRWVTHHLHTFRSELFGHVEEEHLVDPDTGEFWESADDQAIYLAMLELAGTRARHIHRTTCVYNPRAALDPSRDRAGSREREGRIRRSRRYRPLRSLEE